MKRSLILAAVLAGLASAYVGRLAWRASKDLVTLEAHDLPLREVIRKIERQTWESIEVHKDVDGRVTLNVEDQPLPVVLSIIADQVNSRWTVAYPLYTTKQRLASARQYASGKVGEPPVGWTNWNARLRLPRGEGRGPDGAGTNGPVLFGGPGGWGDEDRPHTPVSLTVKDQTPLEVASELRQFGRVKVVPEDGTVSHVFMTLDKVPMDEAVAKLARLVSRNWAKFYALESRRPPQRSPEQREQMADRPMPSPEQREQRMEQMAANPEFQQRMENRMLSGLKNSTPQQRAERDKRRVQMRARAAAR